MNQLLDLRRMVTLECWTGNSMLSFPRYLVVARRLRTWPERRAVGRFGVVRVRVKL